MEYHLAIGSHVIGQPIGHYSFEFLLFMIVGSGPGYDFPAAIYVFD